MTNYLQHSILYICSIYCEMEIGESETPLDWEVQYYIKIIVTLL